MTVYLQIIYYTEIDDADDGHNNGFINIKVKSYLSDNVFRLAKERHQKVSVSDQTSTTCIADISILMNRNMLKLKKNKTKFIVFSSKQHAKKIENIRIKVGRLI